MQRGWVENIDAESTYFDLKWSRNARVPSNLLDWQLYNHFPRNFELSVKWQLYENIKKTDRVTSAKYLKFFPRSYRLDNKGSDEFFENYKAMYTISLLKDYKSNPINFIPFNSSNVPNNTNFAQSGSDMINVYIIVFKR